MKAVLAGQGHVVTLQQRILDLELLVAQLKLKDSENTFECEVHPNPTHQPEFIHLNLFPYMLDHLSLFTQSLRQQLAQSKAHHGEAQHSTASTAPPSTSAPVEKKKWFKFSAKE